MDVKDFTILRVGTALFTEEQVINLLVRAYKRGDFNLDFAEAIQMANSDVKSMEPINSNVRREL